MAEDIAMSDQGGTSGTRQLRRDRARRWALLCTLRILRRSVLNGRPMSLPNLLRFYRRRAGDMDALRQAEPPDEQWLIYFYMREQPFTDTHWRWWYRTVNAGRARYPVPPPSRVL